MENLVITRFDAQKFARRAYEAGFTFIGGCCGFEPYHIRALAEEVNSISYHLQYFAENVAS